MNSTLDTVAPDAALTLREAIATVNAQSSAALSAAEKALVTGAFGSSDTIQFAASLSGSTIALSGTSRLSIQRSVAITGPGANLLTIHGGRDAGATTGAQIFFIDGRTVAGNTTAISGLTLTKAFARAGTGTTTGGIDNSIRGGALFNDSADFTLSKCFVVDNFAGFGGAVHGIGGTTRLQNSTFTNNRGTTNGGAVTNGSGHTTFLQQCTVHFNQSEGFAAAVTNAGMLLSIAQSTITDNFTVNPTLRGDASGGIYTNRGSKTDLRNTVVANNVRDNLDPQELNSTDENAGGAVSVDAANSFNNFIGHPQSAGGLVHNVNGNILGNGAGGFADAKMTSLAMNGGPMPTRVPLAGSPLLGKGQNFNQPFNFDARGFGRFAFDDGTTGFGAVIDIGATERISQAFGIVVNDNSGTSVIGTSTNLVSAVRIANENPGAQTVTFSPTVFATPQTITLAVNGNKELAINESLTITGPAARVTIDAQGKSRIFNTSVGASADIVTISNLTLTGGTSSVGGAVNIGDETVNFNDCTFTGNTSSGDGGAINVQTMGMLTLNRCTVSGNSALDDGGGIYFFNGGSATILDSAIVSNTASGLGGGFYFFGQVAAGGLTFRNTTISGNSSIASGGGIALISFAGTALIQNSTIANNTASNGATGAGGGISLLGGTGIIDLQSSMVTGNTNPNVPDLNSGTPVNAANSAIGAPTGFSFGTDTGNLIGQNLLLGPLANNGGPTLTHQPAANSPVRGKGSNPANLQFDARGSGFPRQDGTGVDIGAVETAPPVPLNLVVTTTADSGAGSLRQAILDANANFGPDGISFQSGLGDIVLTSAELTLTDGSQTSINGPASGTQVVRRSSAGGTPEFRVVTVSAGATAKLTSLTIRNGVAPGTTDGGGVNNVGGNVTIEDCVIRENTAGGNGGGVQNTAGGTLLIRDSSILNNSLSTTGNATGAALLNFQATATLINCTISGNSSNGSDAGIYNFPGGTMNVENCTITANVADADNNGIGTGGGFGNGGAGTLRNTIVIGNFNRTGASAKSLDLDIGNFDAASSFNLVGVFTGSGLTNGVNGNQIGVTSAKLAPLAANGSNTFTYALLPGSPAINSGNPATTTADARGFPVFGVKDIGAFEMQQLFILPATLPNGQVGTAYSQIITVGFPTLPQPTTTSTLTVTAGSLPAGLTLAANGTLSGTPTSGGTSNFTLTATTSTGDVKSQDYTLAVSANTPPTIAGLVNLTTAQFTSSQPFTIGDAETPAADLKLSATSSNPALVPPAGIQFAGSGTARSIVITTPAALGTATITLTVTDASGLTAQASFLFTRTSLENEFVIGSDRGCGSEVLLRNPDNTPRFTLAPFGASFTGGVRTAAGDVNGDGVADVIAASGPGMPGQVLVFDGVTQKVIPTPLPNNQPFGSTFTRGIIVAAGDLNADGLSDLIITAEAGGGARVRIFQSTGSGFVQRSDFIALIGGDNVPDSKIFRGGSRATVSDINGDGTNDLIWAAGAGGGPRIATFNGKQLDNGSNVTFKLTGDFFALSTTLRDGAYLAGGDVDGDGIGDLIAGGGSGAPPQVVGFSGKNLINNNFSKFLDFNFGVNSGQGIRVAVKDVNLDNRADVIVGSAPGAGSRVAAFNGTNLNGANTGAAIFDFSAFPGFSGGVFVG